MTTKKFKDIIWKHYEKNQRDLLWRKTRNPYNILVSEIMLQQTQVSRVEIKYASFLKKFPTIESLAQAKLTDVLVEWQGLGYNRRAVYLKQCAEKVVEEYAGKFPKDFKTLCSLPGIGPATAGDMLAFAWNIPVVVIETNIRSVFIHFFFQGREQIHDREILPLIERTLDRENPREWYWALFDYGAHLKQTSNPSKRSAHHTTQSRFLGSHRQKRAQVLRTILAGNTTSEKIAKELALDIAITHHILSQFVREGILIENNSVFKVR
jgi:A/G-specific adenine glycosylase